MITAPRRAGRYSGSVPGSSPAQSRRPKGPGATARSIGCVHGAVLLPRLRGADSPSPTDHDRDEGPGDQATSDQAERQRGGHQGEARPPDHGREPAAHGRAQPLVLADDVGEGWAEPGVPGDDEAAGAVGQEVPVPERPEVLHGGRQRRAVRRRGDEAAPATAPPVGAGAAVKVALTLWSSLFMLTTQMPVPVHAPLQPVKLAPASGVAVRATAVPAA